MRTFPRRQRGICEALFSDCSHLRSSLQPIICIRSKRLRTGIPSGGFADCCLATPWQNSVLLARAGGAEFCAAVPGRFLRWLRLPPRPQRLPGPGLEDIQWPLNDGRRLECRKYDMSEIRRAACWLCHGTHLRVSLMVDMYVICAIGLSYALSSRKNSAPVRQLWCGPCRRRETQAGRAGAASPSTASPSRTSSTRACASRIGAILPLLEHCIQCLIPRRPRNT